LDRLVFLIFLLLIAIPFIQPLGLPLKISESSVEYYDYLTNVEQDGVIVWDERMTFVNWAELAPTEIVTYYESLKLCAEKNCKFIVLAGRPEGAANAHKLFQMFEPEINQWGLEYGVDYVHLGYVTGEEAMVRQIAQDLKGLTSVDYYGNPISELPILEGVDDITDYSLMGFIILTSGEMYVRQWWSYAQDLGHQVPIINNVQSGGVQINMPFVRAGQINAMVNGLRGGAELEQLSQRLGPGTISIDAFSLAHLYGIALIIISNAWYYTRGGEE
jgi:hypothetical protein